MQIKLGKSIEHPQIFPNAKFRAKKKKKKKNQILYENSGKNFEKFL